MDMGDWASASNRYGCDPMATGAGLQAPTARMGVDDIASGARGLVDPRNPLLWLGGIIAVTVGFAAVAGSARIGKATIRASVGSTGG